MDLLLDSLHEAVPRTINCIDREISMRHVDRCNQIRKSVLSNPCTILTKNLKSSFKELPPNFQKKKITSSYPKT